MEFCNNLQGKAVFSTQVPTF